MVSEIGHFIDGRRVGGKSGRFGEVFNPASGEISARVAFASPAEVDAAVQSRTTRFPGLGAHASAPPRARDVRLQGAAREEPRPSSPR